MRVTILALDGAGGRITHVYTCTDAQVTDGVLRLENRPNRQQSAVGMRTVEHVISIPLDKILNWKET